MQTFYDDSRFLDMVASMPLVSIDLLVEDSSGRYLLGRRTNRPAQGTLFVPGGRILKDECISHALGRVVRKELGIHPNLGDWRACGVYQHFYDDNFKGESGVSTHYIVLAYRLKLLTEPRIEFDAQHSEMHWLSVDALLARDDVHQYTKAYFVNM
ncbi:GDP-mannose mannosyl hydrolase [bioreactor metagenome]|uniref:GDP-mannose mannosyl hydrolase n=2 Tax=root TaxID=1 RepID=A0A323UPQ2_9RHOO|nr:GDP-mannose mannosyl hydrolase [Parazoarcus communis]NMG72258.1 GDP-mannose mannosyl hydrolase [Parazoarcus communis SWub3 = DSM 12120]PZA14474.1 GDP-mannose mannosyl hydrolase [Azoarcus communis] [Parazoarcus communis SWub3 = DSM 12120]